MVEMKSGAAKKAVGRKKIKESFADRIFDIVNTLLLTLVQVLEDIQAFSHSSMVKAEDGLIML